MNEELIYLLYETSIKLVKIIDQLSIENNMLDDQHYLCFKDSLNALSLDPDKPDTNFDFHEYKKQGLKELGL